MSNVITIIKKELARFFGDKRLVFTTLIMPGLMIYLMYSLMGDGMMKQFTTADDYVAKAYAVNMPEVLKDNLFRGTQIEWEDWDGNPADQERILKEIGDGEKDILVYFPEGFMDAVEAYQQGTTGGTAPQIEMYYNSEKSDSMAAYERIMNMLDIWEEEMVNKFDVNRAETGLYGNFDQGTESGMMSKMLAGMLPMLIMTFIFSGVSGVAPESIAGEKERGTIATLLVTPMKRSALALGKVISLSFIALMAGISSFLGTTLSLPKMMGDEVDVSAAMSYGALDYVMLFLVIISTVLVMVSVISIISAYAKSVKEATTMMAPFMIVVILVSLLPMLGVDFGGKAVCFIPMLNSVTSMSGIFGFERDITTCLASIGTNIVVTGILVTILTKMFGNENVMFGK